MKLSKSIDFLLENAGEVILYRLHKEILHDLSVAQEEALLDAVMQTPYYRLVSGYVKPNGYIGVGMHSADRFEETRLQDGETAARLLSYYAIPKTQPIIKDFIDAMRDDEILRSEFMFYPPAYEQFRTRYYGIYSGTSLMVIIYAMQAMLGYGDDDYVKPFLDISLDAFRAILNVNSISDIAEYDERLLKRYKTPYYIDADTHVPCAYHLAALSYSSIWRNKRNTDMLAAAVNHICSLNLIGAENGVPAKVDGKYRGSFWMFLYPFMPYIHKRDRYIGVMYRRILTELAMLGIGQKADVLRESAINVKEALEFDGVLRWDFQSPYQKNQYRAQKWPTAYCDVWLEADHNRKNALECDLTFWAVQLLYLLGEAEF